MVARGETGFLIASLEQKKGVFGSNASHGASERTTGGAAEELCLVVYGPLFCALLLGLLLLAYSFVMERGSRHRDSIGTTMRILEYSLTEIQKAEQLICYSCVVLRTELLVCHDKLDV